MRELAKQITVWCHGKEQMDEEEQEIVVYGMELILENIVKTAAMLLVALLFGRFWQTVLVLIIFSFLRYWAGGVHMKTSLGCFGIMLLMWGFSMAAGEYLVLELPIYAVCSWIVIMMFAILAPKGTVKNPINDWTVRRKMKRRTMLLVLLFLGIGIFGPFAGIRAYLLAPALFEAITLIPKES